MILLAATAFAGAPLDFAGAQIQAPALWTVPEVGALPNDAFGSQVRQGRDLITATYALIGPEVPDPAKRFAGNNLACSDCHLEAGERKFGLSIFGLFGVFPQYTARRGAEITIEDRVNSCMVRSMNGRGLPTDSPEMQAIIGADYLNPQLTIEQAWDVATYLISQPRPKKAGLEKDFPNLLQKLVDMPYGPYADGFSEQQHKYGPFAPMRAAIARAKQKQ